jgi:thiol-disulfide isomerase/thioredoxin
MKTVTFVLVSLVIVIAAGCATQTQTTANGANQDAMMAEEGFEMINGKMMMLNEKTKTQSMMTSDATLQDGSVVMTNGKVIRKDGSSFMLQEGESIWMDGSFMEAGEMMESTDEVEMKKEAVMESTGYQGAHLGGSHDTPYIAFTQTDYEKALAEGKTILLYFYANWCPLCKAEQPETIAAFNDLSNPHLVGFRVNYKDSETDADEEALAKQFGITYQHTKVILKDGKQTLKSLDSWKKTDYLNALGA